MEISIRKRITRNQMWWDLRIAWRAYVGNPLLWVDGVQLTVYGHVVSLVPHGRAYGRFAPPVYYYIDNVRFKPAKFADELNWILMLGALGVVTERYEVETYRARA